MQLIDSDIAFLEVQIVTIRHARIIPHPLADFRQAFAGDREKRAKCMAHDMRCNPGKILPQLPAHEFQIAIKGANEIVAIPTLSTLDFRRNAPRSVHRESFQEPDKHVRQWNRSRFAILRSKGFRLLHSERTASYRKPGGTGFDDFVPAQPSFKSGVHNKAHHTCLGLRHDFGWNPLPTRQQRISKFRFAVFGFRPEIPTSHTNATRWIRGNYGSFFLEPAEKGAQAHHVTLSCGFGDTVAFLPVESLQIGSFDRSDRPSRPDPACKPFQCKFLVFGREPTELIAGKFESDEGLDFPSERAPNCEIRTVRQLKRHPYRFPFISSFKRDRLPNASAHSRKIPPAPFSIKSLYGYHSAWVANRVANRQ